MASGRGETGSRSRLGQFLLLVLTNGFVGMMVGQERSILPLLAAEEFGLVSQAAAFSFLISFGAAKALSNLLAGSLADRFGRRRILILGWFFGIPVPLILIFADQWLWIVLGNILLGVNQALCWSATAIMKIDLAGRRHAGLATAANEWAGYVGAAVAAWTTGYLAAAHGLRPVPFYPGVAIALAGLAVSLLLIKPTLPLVQKEADQGAVRAGGQATGRMSLPVIVRQTWQDKNLLTACQAGLITNLKDGLIWALIPIYLQGAGLSYARIGVITALYPIIWGFGQLGAGPLSDRLGRKWLIAAGLGLQSFGLLMFAAGADFHDWLLGAALTGLGTALAYPTLLAAVSDLAAPENRGSLLGGYRLWRDAGYALAGLGLGPLVVAFGQTSAIVVMGGLTAASALVVAGRMSARLR